MLNLQRNSLAWLDYVYLKRKLGELNTIQDKESYLWWLGIANT